jgi:hypothetical protein
MTSERITGGKRENKVSNNHTISEVSHDDIYNDERHDYDDDLNLPVDDEMSIFLPDLNAMTGYNYKTQDIDYEMKLNLLKGYPREKTPIKFIFFTVNTKGVLPFLLFLFYKQVNHGGKGIKGNETFIIPELKKDQIDEYDKYNAKNLSDIVISKLFLNMHDNDKPTYRGYKTYHDGSYLFFEYIPTETISQVERFNRRDTLIWATVSEIVDDKKILNFDIEPASSDFFINHLDVISLYRYGGVLKHETPIISYYGGYNKTTNYTAVFGVSKRSNYASLGPFYYFASYSNAMRYAIFSATNSPVKIDGKLITIDEKGRFDKGGMVRFALFVGKMKLYDNKGKPDMVHQINVKKEPVTSWIDDYNSAFVGLYELNHEGKKIYNHAKYVVKQYAQQIPLTYHYVNTDVEIVSGDYSNIFIE